MEELKLLVAYTLAISQIYEKVIHHVHLRYEILYFFTNTTRVKQGCLLSPITFGLCIDAIE